MNFIQIYDNALLDEECDEIIDFFESLPEEQTHEGQIFGFDHDDILVDKSYKDSRDYWGNFHQWNNVDKILASRLAENIKKYRETHKEVDNIAVWELDHEYNIQRYYPNQGYHAPHCEHGDAPSTRVLAWMFYLNDVTDGGGTYFTNYDYTTQAKKGRLVIWPAYWTHTHHGVVSPTETKYIATGWYIFTRK